MSAGCENGIGQSSSFAKLSNELAMWAKIQRFPLSATFELTPLCNLRCPMCYVRLDHACMERVGRLLSGEEWLEIARQSLDMGLLNVILTGGEPFLHPDFWEIYHGLKEMGLLITIYTNGCLIDEDIAQKLGEDPPYNMKISVYGASDETYASMCGDPKGFTRVCRGLELLREAGVPFYCSTTIVRENRDDLLALCRYMYDRQYPFLPAMAVTLSARGALSDPAASRLTTAEEGWNLERLEKERHTVSEQPFGYCAAYATFYFMTWDGRMTYCAFAPKPYVKVSFPLKLRETWEKLLELTDAIRVPKECADCEHAEFCRRCPGLLASESGDPERVCAGFCAQAAERHRLYDACLACETSERGEKTQNSGDLQNLCNKHK
ncbi:MAG: radical SAM protein [Clostridia bacterium]|nr:radical SAM protein [Clostridia bacterium]